MATQSHALKNTARALLRRAPGLEAAIRGLHFAVQFRSVSSSDLSQVAEELSAAWKDEGIPAKQRALVQPHLDEYRAGQPNRVFDALVDILVHNVSELENKILLEIGCSTGHYAEVLRSRGVAVTYQGCDFSEGFIRMARQIYPSNRFDVEDATRLSYESRSFDIVVSGGCLSLIRDYEKVIAEAVRVSRQFVIFHRIPVLHLAGPAFYTMKAYGVEMLEIHFNEQELVRAFGSHGLQIVDINSHHCLPKGPQADPLIYKTYLCRKAV